MWFKMHTFSKSALFPNKNPEIVKFGQICKFNSVQGIAGINFPSISGSCGRIVKREKIPEKLWKIAKKKTAGEKMRKLRKNAQIIADVNFPSPDLKFTLKHTQTQTNRKKKYRFSSIKRTTMPQNAPSNLNEPIPRKPLKNTNHLVPRK